MESSSPYKVDKDIKNLPKSGCWHHRPVYFATGDSTRTTWNSSSKNKHLEEDSSLPLDQEIDFDGNLFKGKILMRIKNAANCNQDYFNGKKRTKQIVISGQFKERISCGDVWFGDLYEKPLKMHSVAKIAIPLFQRLVPGIEMDVLSENPRIMALLGGTAQTLSVHNPGDEPDMMGDLLECNTELLGPFKSAKHRRKMLRKPKTASKYYYDPKLVYTFQVYDDAIDISDFSVKVPFGRVPLIEYMNHQPFTFAASTKDRRSIFSFRVFHESLLSDENDSEIEPKHASMK